MARKAVEINIEMLALFEEASLLEDGDRQLVFGRFCDIFQAIKDDIVEKDAKVKKDNRINAMKLADVHVVEA